MNAIITKTRTDAGFAYATEHGTRNDKRDFRYALIHGENKRIIKLCNMREQMRREVNQWYYSHAIAVEIEGSKILWEIKRD